MIRRYFHILRNLPGILDRIERELGSKATKASVDTLRYTVSKKVDADDHSTVCSIINERLNRTHERLTKLEATPLPAVEATDITPLVKKVRAPRKPKGEQ